MNLPELRKQIDLVDADIISLLNRRMELTLRTRKLKQVTEVPTRESEILSQVKTRSPGLINPQFSDQLFQQIIAESKRLQDLNLRLIGFQGEHGAFSEGAVRVFDSQAVAIPHPAFADVFSGVTSGILDFGIVPVENSLAGNVTQVEQLLIETELLIVGELTLSIHHALLAPPDTDYRDIRIVYSHPMALTQCRGFITRNRLDTRQYYDTAGAALMISQDRPFGCAAIANRLCAELYNLEILKDNVEDNQSNTTRFLVLGRTPLDHPGNKCSIVFATVHRPGALYQMLKVFAEAGLNLTKIESKRDANDPTKVVFLVDFLGSAAEPTVQRALDEIKTHSGTFKFLGCYQAAAETV